MTEERDDICNVEEEKSRVMKAQSLEIIKNFLRIITKTKPEEKKIFLYLSLNKNHIVKSVHIDNIRLCFSPKQAVF